MLLLFAENRVRGALLTSGRLLTASIVPTALMMMAAAVSCGGHGVRGLPYFDAEGPIAHHDLTVSTNPYHSSVDISDELHLAPDLLDDGKLRIALSPAAAIESITAKDRELRYQPVATPRSWPQGASVYEIEIPPKTRTIALHAEITLTRSDGLPGAISTAGAFLPASGLWYPQRPGERSTYRFTVITDSEWDVATSAQRTHHSLEGNTQRQSWEASAPLPALDIAIAPFTVYTFKSDLDVPEARAYLLGQHDAQADVWLSAAERQLDHHGFYLGPFPSDSFTLIEVPDYLLAEAPWRVFSGLALSTRTLSEAISPDVAVSRAMFDTQLGWADAPQGGQGDWRPALQGWLEAEAPTGLALPPDASERRESWLRDWREGRNPQDERPLGEAGPATPVRVGRGAMVLHMLHQWLGKDTFRAGLNALTAGGAQGKTGWLDLQRVMESEADAPLDWFFDHWLGRMGAPRLRLQSVEQTAVSIHSETVPALKVKVSRDGFTAPIMVPIVVELTQGRVIQRLPLDGPVGTALIPLAELTERELASLNRGRMPAPEVFPRPRGSGSNAMLGGSGPEKGLGAVRSVRVDEGFDVLRELWPEELLPRLGDVLSDPKVPVLAGKGTNLVEDSTLVAALMGRRTISPEALSEAPPQSVVVVTRWDAVMGSRVQVGPLGLGLPRDLVVQKDLVWYRMQPHATAQVTAVLAVPHPRDPSKTVLLFLTHSERKLSAAVPFLSMAHQAGFMIFSGDEPVARGRYEPGPNPLMELMGADDAPNLGEPAAWD